MKKYLTVNKETYDKIGEQYYQRLKNPSKDEYMPDDIVKFIFDEYNLHYHQNPHKVLELGPGSGGIINSFAKRGCVTCAIDISSNMINYAKKTSGDTIFIQEDILSCRSFFDKEFDVIYAGAFIHLFTLKDEAIILSKIKSWLTDKGVLFINTTLSDKSVEGYFIKDDYAGENKRYRRKWERTELLVFLNGLGYNILKESIWNEMSRNKKWINIILNAK